MISTLILEELEQLVPKGDRSQFVNAALRQALIDFSRKKGAELMDEFRKEQGLKLPSDEKLKEQIRYGLK